jgi:DNA-binding response OmpR family regulator
MDVDRASDRDGGLTCQKGKRILVVEDEVIIAMHLAQILRSGGYSVVGPYIRLAQAEQEAAASQIDGALLDFNLGGGETSARLARLLRDKGVPFAFLTASDPAEIGAAVEAPYILPKPLASDHVLETIARW